MDDRFLRRFHLNYDSQVQALVQYLKDHGQWNNTILILYTDHGQQWLTRNRLRVKSSIFQMINTPGATTENTQNIDIAPTLLDYLDIQIPTWMEGNSLLGKLDTNRLIIAGMINKASVIQCQNWYIFNLMDGTVNQGQVASYVNPCEANTLDTPAEIRAKFSQVLKPLGYSLPDR